MHETRGALLLVALLIVLPIVPTSAQEDAQDDAQETDGSLASSTNPDHLVPGTSRLDLLIGHPRSWVLEAREDHDPREPIFAAEPDDPARGVLAAQIFTDLAAMEAAFLQRDEQGARLQPVYNIGTILSSIRFDPPFALEGGDALDTLDAPRLDWTLPSWENTTVEDPETGKEHHRIHLTMQAPIPRPDENGTSPPPGGSAPQQDESAADGTDMRLTWNITLTNRTLPHPTASLSPSAIRFSWTLEGAHEGTFDENQRLRWMFLYDYDTVRTVVRPDPEGLMDGAYLVSGDHRAALRLATIHFPLDPREEDEPVQSRPVDLEVRPSAGGPGPDTEGRRIPSPLVLEAHTRPVGHSTRGYTYTGELRFYQAEPTPENGTSDDDQAVDDDDDGGDQEPPGAGAGGWPLSPRLWHALLAVALALLVTVPRWRRSTMSTTP